MRSGALILKRLAWTRPSMSLGHSPHNPVGSSQYFLWADFPCEMSEGGSGRKARWEKRLVQRGEDRERKFWWVSEILFY